MTDEVCNEPVRCTLCVLVGCAVGGLCCVVVISLAEAAAVSIICNGNGAACLHEPLLSPLPLLATHKDSAAVCLFVSQDVDSLKIVGCFVQACDVPAALCGGAVLLSGG